MKLPRNRNLGVQGLGRKNVGAPLANANRRAAQVEELGAAKVNLVREEHVSDGVVANALIGLADVAVDSLKQIAVGDAQHYTAVSDFGNQQIETALSQPYMTPDQVQALGGSYEGLEEFGEQIPTHKVSASIMQSYYDATIEGNKEAMNGLAYDMWREDFDKKSNVMRLGLQKDILKSEMAFRRDRTLEDANILAKQGKTIDAMDMIHNSTHFAPSEKTKYIEEIGVDAEKQRFYGAINSGSSQAISNELERLRNPDYAGPMNQKQLENARGLLRAELPRARAIEAAGSAEAVGKLAGDLSIAVSRGEAGEPQIDALYNARIIGDKERVRLYKEVDRVRKRDIAGAVEIVDVEAKLRLGRGQFDPTDAKDRKQLDDWFEKNQTMDAAERVIETTGHIPKLISRQLNSYAASGDGGMWVRGAEQYALIQRINPFAAQSLPDRTRTLYTQVNEMSGLPPDQIQKMIEDKITTLPSTQEEKERRYAEALEESDPIEFLESAMNDAEHLDQGTIFTSDLGAKDAPPSMIGNFNAQVKRSYMMTGDMNAAMKTGVNTVVGEYAIDATNGEDEIVHLPPTKVLNAPVEMIRRDIKRQFGPDSGHGLKQIIAQRFDRSYTAVRIDEDGMPQPVRNDNGSIKRYVPDIANTADIIYNEQIEAAVAERDADIKRSVEREEKSKDIQIKKQGRTEEGAATGWTSGAPLPGIGAFSKSKKGKNQSSKGPKI